MILLDSDVLIDLLRNYPPAAGWFDALHENGASTEGGTLCPTMASGL